MLVFGFDISKQQIMRTVGDDRAGNDTKKQMKPVKTARQNQPERKQEYEGRKNSHLIPLHFQI
jgi:hypothetical protein